ncbi:unnamed protein product [Calicophoron daubneyi]|uniref:Uncharacterized protein n=1 Tax=Calicophoron daubneyi TaxID=300641 RepID=A0AAV2T1B7_CALDB
MVPDNSPIHVAMMAVGSRHLPKIFTLVKNILYYQGRIHPQMNGCNLSVATISTSQCETSEPEEPNPLHIHLITDKESRAAVIDYFYPMHLARFQLHFYDFGSLHDIINYVPDELFNPRERKWKRRCRTWLPTRFCKWINTFAKVSHSNWTILKVAWPEILPHSVNKILAIDTDVIFNQNIRNLWNHFCRFNSTQMVGGVFEMTESLKEHMDSPEQPMIGNGFNSGVLLLDLQKMRHQNWASIWRETVVNINATDRTLPFPDQKIYNVIMYRKRHYFYEITCEWNIVITKKAPLTICPVAWIVGVPNRRNCLIPAGSVLRLAGVIHHCDKPKPGDIPNEGFRNRSPVKTVKLFRYQDMHSTFREVYYAFEQMDKRCFI